jgi:phospholipid-translocating ATPase
MDSDSDIAIKKKSKKSKGSGRFGLYRTSTTDSTKSEIMNMKTGKRSSFMGFAYSSDDNHVFDEYRKSVYRTYSNHQMDSQPNLSSRLSMVSLPPVNLDNSKEHGQDWMPIDGFKLRQYDTEPSLFSSSSTKKGTSSFGKKMMKAMKKKITQPQHKKHQTPTQSRLDPIMQTRDSSMDSSMQGSIMDQSMLVPLTPSGNENFVPPSVPNPSNEDLLHHPSITNIEPLQPFLLHQHHQSSHHDSFDQHNSSDNSSSGHQTPSNSSPSPSSRTHY